MVRNKKEILNIPVSSFRSSVREFLLFTQEEPDNLQFWLATLDQVNALRALLRHSGYITSDIYEYLDEKLDLCSDKISELEGR